MTVVEDFEPDDYAVDLGLTSGLKWASCNIGASKPEGFGNFYAWGETKTKRAFYWGNYPYCGNPRPEQDTIHWEDGGNGPNLVLFKYNTKDEWHLTEGEDDPGPDEIPLWRPKMM